VPSPTVIKPEDPPGFVVSKEAQKAAFDNGFRLERGVDGGWLRYASTTAKGEIWIAGASASGPWLLSVERAEIVAEIAVSPSPFLTGPGAASYAFATLRQLYAVLDRVYRLGVSLPDVPLAVFRKRVQGLPMTTEAECLVVQRVGQDVFRKALLAYWGGRCPLTGIAEPALLRASHILPWAECGSDEQRLDVHNGLLLSALWDAAFDAGLVSFADDGSVLVSPRLGPAAAEALGLKMGTKLDGLTVTHRANLDWHRKRYGFHPPAEA